MITTRVRNCTDIRSRAQLVSGAALAQEMADLRLLAEYQRRVRTNPKEVARLRRGMA